MTTEEQTEQANQEEQYESSDQDKEQSDLEVLRKEVESLKKENERIRKEKLDSRTSPSYLKQRQEQVKQQREAQLMNRNLPPGQQLTRDQMEQMTVPDIIDYVNRSAQRVYSQVTTDKIAPMVAMSQDSTTQVQLKELDKLDPDWYDYLDDMTPIARADQRLTATEVYMMALSKNSKWDKLQALRDKLEGKPKAAKEKTEMPKEQVEQTRKPVTGGEKPSVSVGKVKSPQKAMSNRDAARKAYEDAQRGG